jgi:hypothetical protein
MIRFILRDRYKDSRNGLETDSLSTLDAEVPDLECLLLAGGLAENGYEIHEVIAAEVFPPRATGAQP